ncbi:Cytochrome P450 [Corchorus capsularis]|uniref:Cytochrome P450 n=1 Tax=Corchorus capsularis TaxID=210143 RepID=A0A1R3J1V2_COCAP|nr:Cytochrome P450 [Corchorus capsularis]
METWFIILITISISLLFRVLITLFSSSNPKKPSQPLPPGPINIPIISNISWLMKSFSDLEPILRNLHGKFGPMVTLNILSRPSIFVADRSLAHQALVQNGALFADRPEAPTVGKIVSCNQHNINSAFYGSTWRLLRRNLTAEILHPSRIKSYSHARKWVLEILFESLLPHSKSTEPVRVIDHFQYAMFCLLVLMCFGDKLNQEQIKEVEDVQRRLLLGLGTKFNILNFWPKLTRILLRNRWNEFFQVIEDQEKVLTRLIRARKKVKEEKAETSEVLAYVDTLLDLQLPEEEEQRKLTEQEIASLSSEFLNAGTDTTSTALQWIMANMVKYPHVQEKLFMEIQGVMENGSEEEEVKEEDLQKMPYLKAVILEGLRRHPPGHFVLPHTVREDTSLGGYLVPKNATINFLVAEMGWDPKVWEDSMAFKPERFLNNSEKKGTVEMFDITGSREIKMMPFGVGRRICPGLGLAMLHLEYFVANLVWKFEWKAVDGDEVSLEEKQEFTVVMKTPLQAQIYPRIR